MYLCLCMCMCVDYRWHCKRIDVKCRTFTKSLLCPVEQWSDNVIPPSRYLTVNCLNSSGNFFSTVNQMSKCFEHQIYTIQKKYISLHSLYSTRNYYSLLSAQLFLFISVILYFFSFNMLFWFLFRWLVLLDFGVVSGFSTDYGLNTVAI